MDNPFNDDINTISNLDEPKKYGDYMNFEDGINHFRILVPKEKFLAGYEFWQTVGKKEDKTDDRKPIRVSRVAFESNQNPYVEEINQLDERNKPKFFWCIPVFNYKANKVQILFIKSAMVRKALKELLDNPKYEDITGYDLAVKKSGKDLNTEYALTRDDKEPMSATVIAAWDKVKDKIQLQNIFEKLGDPFMALKDSIVDDNSAEF